MQVRVCMLLFLGLMLLPVFFAHAKPSTSLSVSMEWLTAPIDDQVAELQVVVLSGISSNALRLELNLPEHVQMIEGEGISIIKVQRGIPAEVRYKVLVSNNASGSIEATASIGTKGQAFFSVIYALPLDDNANESPALKSRSAEHKNYRFTERNGVGIREYPLSK